MIFFYLTRVQAPNVWKIEFCFLFWGNNTHILSLLNLSVVFVSGCSPAGRVSVHPEGWEGGIEDDHCHGWVLRQLLRSVCSDSYLLRLFSRWEQRLPSRHHPSFFLQEFLCLQPTDLCLHEQTGEDIKIPPYSHYSIFKNNFLNISCIYVVIGPIISPTPHFNDIQYQFYSHNLILQILPDQCKWIKITSPFFSLTAALWKWCLARRWRKHLKCLQRLRCPQLPNVWR